MYENYRGLQVTFPTRLFNSDYVKAKIPQEYDGTNIKQLAKKYGYSEKSVRRILKENL
jgi:Mor family transcriptional regulator